MADKPPRKTLKQRLQQQMDKAAMRLPDLPEAENLRMTGMIPGPGAKPLLSFDVALANHADQHGMGLRLQARVTAHPQDVAKALLEAPAQDNTAKRSRLPSLLPSPRKLLNKALNDSGLDQILTAALPNVTQKMTTAIDLQMVQSPEEQEQVVYDVPDPDREVAADEARAKQWLATTAGHQELAPGKAMGLYETQRGTLEGGPFGSTPVHYLARVGVVVGDD